MEYQERSAQRAAKSRLGEVRDGPEEDRHAAGRRPRRPHHLHGGAGDFQGAHQAEDSASLGAQGLPEISAARDQQVLHGLAHIPCGARVSHTVWRHRRHGAERRVRGDQGRLPKGRAGFLIQFGVTDDTARSGAYEAIKDDYPRGVPGFSYSLASPTTRRGAARTRRSRTTTQGACRLRRAPSALRRRALTRGRPRSAYSSQPSRSSAGTRGRRPSARSAQSPWVSCTASSLATGTCRSAAGPARTPSCWRKEATATCGRTPPSATSSSRRSGPRAERLEGRDARGSVGEVGRGNLTSRWPRIGEIGSAEYRR